MRVLLKVTWDMEAGNELARKGELGKAVQSILEELKPEAAYFASLDGNRGGYIFVDLKDASQIPAMAEPWFLRVKAKVEIIPVMVIEDLMKAGPAIEAAVKKHG